MSLQSIGERERAGINPGFGKTVFVVNDGLCQKRRELFWQQDCASKIDTFAIGASLMKEEPIRQ